jgi:dTDP-4-dehydrorhamnose reductase
VKRILVTGAGGFVGGNLCRVMAESAEVIPAFHLRNVRCGIGFVADLLARFSADGLVREARPDVVIHCAGDKDVRRCDDCPTEAMELNAIATGRLAAACDGKCRFVYVSTNHLWDGNRGMYTEADAPCPVDGYGRSKRAGEELASAECRGALIVRTAAVYGRDGPVMRWARRTLEMTGELAAWALAYSSPTLADDLAMAILGLLDRGAEGVRHFAGSERMNRFEFFDRARQCLGWPGRVVPVESCGTLPRDCSLDSSRTYAELGWQPRTLDAGLLAMGGA